MKKEGRMGGKNKRNEEREGGRARDIQTGKTGSHPKTHMLASEI